MVGVNIPFLVHGAKLFWQLEAALQIRLLKIAREFGNCVAFVCDSGLMQIPSSTLGQDGAGG